MGFKSEAALWGASILTVGAVGAGTLFGLGAIGLPITPTSYQAPEVIEPLALQWSETNAHNVINTALAAEYEGWTLKASSVQLSPAALPVSCLSGVKGAAGSEGRTFATPTGDIEVTLSAYTAGAGSAVYNSFLEALKNCGSAEIQGTEVVGAESAVILTSPGGVNFSTVIWRRGDIVGFASSSGVNTLQAAQAVDAAMTPMMNEYCFEQSSPADQTVRNPWFDRPAFAGLKVTEDVSIPDPGLPSLPPNPSAPPADPNTPAKTPVVETPIPAPELPVAEVQRPKQPVWPVWPELPAPVDIPGAPGVPVAPAFNASIQIQTEDINGPGCGWEFAGTAAPIFDNLGVEAENEAIRTVTTDSLKLNADTYQNEILTYWKDYAAYTDAVNAYGVYAAQVAEVQVAWDAIAQQWSVYYTQLANYNAEIRARDNFIARKDQAQRDFDAATAACLAPPPPVVDPPEPTQEPTEEPTDTPSAPAPEPTQEPTANPSPTPSPSPSPSMPTDAPTRSGGGAGGTMSTSVIVNADTYVPPPCPVRPLILDQEPPAVGEAPAKPADPRP